MSFLHNNSYNSLKKSDHSNAARHLERKEFQVHRITEPRLFSVAINSLGTDADEVVSWKEMRAVRASFQGAIRAWYPLSCACARFSQKSV